MPEALIWGASGSIGSALVRTLKTRGWAVYGAARDELRIPPEADGAVSFDAGDPFSITAAASAIAGQANLLDLVVYAAGGARLATVEELDDAAWAHMLTINLTGAARAARASLPLLREGGHVMFIGAYVDKISFPRFAAYAAAKAGLEPLTAVLTREQRKLKFTLVRPPAVAGRFWDGLPIPLPKNALTPEAVAEAIAGRWERGESGMLDL
jgi:NADP-dependent 3-hydroxy acid dehydrogenase YdfG